MAGYQKLKHRPLSLLALALASSLLLVLCSHWTTVEGSTQQVVASQDDDGDEIFYDAEPNGLGRTTDMDDDEMEDYEETWYDAENEISYDEDAEENVCAGTGAHSCPTCCRRLGFDLPHWNAAAGQCLCYLSEADQNVCKAPVAGDPSAQTCDLCCSNNHYEQSFFSASSRTCYCSLPDEHFYRWAPKSRA